MCRAVEYPLGCRCFCEVSKVFEELTIANGHLASKCVA
jgi:hypothetical protein